VAVGIMLVSLVVALVVATGNTQWFALFLPFSILWLGIWANMPDQDPPRMAFASPPYLEPVQRDDAGELFKIRIPGYARPYTFVRISTGNGQVRDLRVPAFVRTARAGIAWSFGMRERDYVVSRAT